MRKRLLTTLAVLTVLLAGGYLFLWWTAPPRHNIKKMSWQAIQIGMTRDEVKVTLGVPPGHYGRGDGTWFRGGGQFPWTQPSNSDAWSLDDFVIWVVYDADEKVEMRWVSTNSTPHPDPFFTRLRHWLHL